MENKKNDSKWLDKLTEGKGFYITLAVCFCIIGVSGYVLLTSGNDAQMYEVEVGTTADLSHAAGANVPDVKVSMEKEEKPTEAKKEETAVSSQIKVTEATTAAEAKEDNEPPVYIPPVIGKVSKSFSKGELVYDKTMGDYRTHNGVDIECEEGSQVACFSDGTVERVYSDELNGNCVIISHNDGIKSVYKGLDRGITLTEGADIKAGDIIGAAGNTNLTELEEEPHIHFEVIKDGKFIDPLSILSE